MQRADAANASEAVIIVGDAELASGALKVKHLETGRGGSSRAR